MLDIPIKRDYGVYSKLGDAISLNEVHRIMFKSKFFELTSKRPATILYFSIAPTATCDQEYIECTCHIPMNM